MSELPGNCRHMHGTVEGLPAGQLQYEGEVAALALAVLVRLTSHAGAFAWTLRNAWGAIYVLPNLLRRRADC